MTKWADEFSEFKVSFEVRKTLNDKLFLDFLAKIIPIPLKPDHIWIIFTNGSSISKRSGADVILANNFGNVVDFSLRIEFLTTNNQTKYERVIAGISLAETMRVLHLDFLASEKSTKNANEKKFVVRKH